VLPLDWEERPPIQDGTGKMGKQPLYGGVWMLGMLLLLFLGPMLLLIDWRKWS
jgi:hypothetical protein